MFIENDPDNLPLRHPAIYFLRVWRDGQSREIRLRLEDVHTGQAIVFANVDDLAEYLANASETGCTYLAGQTH